MKRRKFISAVSVGALSAVVTKDLLAIPLKDKSENLNKPMVVSTWNHGIEANEEAWKVLSEGGSALDAVEAGVRITESDASNRSVGLGGLPDRDGNVTLDACIMDENSNCGAVAYLQEIEHPISVARKVMEETPHVMIVGDGAQEFALAKGFEKTNLLTPEAKKRNGKHGKKVKT